MLFDTHVNLHGETYASDLDEVLSRARGAGVRRFLAICDKLENFPAIRAIVSGHPDMWCSIGVHPHHAKDVPDLEPQSLTGVLESDQRVAAVGETGLDQHYGYSDLKLQERSFRVHIEAARVTQLPLIVHTREADDLTGDILEEEIARGAFPILLHCYTGGARLAKRAVELGARFSVSGILSFKAAGDVRSVIADVPIDRVILETDCPYLAPTPHRGRRNEPAFLVEVCRAYAELMGLTFEEAAALTTRNALELFGRAA